MVLFSLVRMVLFSLQEGLNLKSIS